MGAVRLTVGAAADRSLGRVFDEWVQASARAKTQVIANMNATVVATAGTAKAGGDAAARATETSNRAIARSLAQIERAQEASRAREIAATDRAAQRKTRAEIAGFDERLRASKKAAAEFERNLDSELKAYERNEAKKARVATRTREQMGVSVSNVASGAYSNFAGVARSTIGYGASLARGAGVQFDLGAAIGKSASLESSVTGTVNSAFAAKGQSATAGDVQGTMGAIRAAGDATRLDYNKLGEGLGDFVAKSSDLETGVATLGDLGKIARATGTDVQQLVSAAGDVNKMLEAGPDKGVRLLEVMRLVAKQGALGNVEIKDMASYAGRITASATRYEGSREANIGTLGALAQLAMKGGATSAAEATGSAAGFARDVTKGAALKRFDAAGIDIFTDDKKTKLRSADKIILDVLEKTQGDQAKIANLFKNDVSKRAINALAQIYTDAGGGAAGSAAVKGEFGKYTTTMSASQVDSAAALSGNTTEGKVQAFNNQVERIAASLSDKLLPQFEQVTPKLLGLIEALGDATAWAASNPGEAIAVAIAGSITKAALGEALSSTLKSSLSGSFGAGLTIASAAITATTVGVLVIDELNDRAKKAEGETENAMVRGSNARVKARLGGDTGDLEKLNTDLTGRIGRAEGASTTGSTLGDLATGTLLLNALSGITNYVSSGSAGTSFDAQSQAAADKDRLPALREELARNAQLLADIKGGTLNVNVVNMPNGNGIDGAGRSGPGP